MDVSQPDFAFVPPSPQELAPLFPAYEIHDFIAAGGMGAVYQAQQKSLDRPVAIKILPREFGADAQFRASFEAEAKAMARLNHPNLISVYDFGDIDGMLFIIMELVSGKSLYHSAYGRAIEQKEAARIITGICRGLAHAHQAGILHRDIKPANILLTLEAQPKIGDFGLARPVGHEHGEDELIFGTPGYSAPEVLNHPEAVGERTDLYAVGVILYELLTGQLPGDSWKPPSAVGNIDAAFDSIVRRATHPSPELRYADANELGDELEDLTRKLTTTVLRRTPVAPAAARTPGTMARPMATTGRPSLARQSSGSGPLVAIAVILVLGLIAIAVALSGGGGPTPPTANPDPQLVTPPKPIITATPTPDIPNNRKLVNTPRERDERRTKPDKPKVPKKNRPDPQPEKEEDEPVAIVTPPMPEPVPEPEPVKPSYPEFDTVDFIDSGRLSLQQKAASIFNEIEEEHTKNIDRFERAANRIVRRLDNRFRDTAEEFVEGYFIPMREANRVTSAPPDKGPDALKDAREDLKEAYEEALAEQQQIDASLDALIAPLQDAYLSGLRRKATELQKVGNTPAETVLLEEAEKTANSATRFVAILKDEDPDALVVDAEGNENE